MAEIVDPTLIAYSLSEPPGPGRVERALDRIAAHYQVTAHEPLVRHAWLGDQCGLAAFSDPGLHCLWPGWVASGELVMASAYVPIGWERLVGSLGIESAPAALAEHVWRQPQSVSRRLNAPAAIMAADTAAGAVQITNDALGAGHLYECEFPGGRAWSNRVGALALFSEVPPAPSARGWALFAASGWFMRDSTPIEGITKVAPGSIVRVEGERVERGTTRALGDLLAPDQDWMAALDEFTEQAQDAIRAAAAAYPEPPRIDLSGGRDSRVAAAAAVAAGIDADFHTSDIAPGEADVARQLVAVAPRTMRHHIDYGGDEVKELSTPLRERAVAVFLVHDGMRHASKVRAKMQIPPRAQSRATISGHGGELGHGFYYSSERQLQKLEGQDIERLVDRLDQASRRAHDAGTDAIYEAARVEFEGTLDEGAAIGISGPSLLDYYYLVDRFAHRSGLAATTHRATVFSSPAFLSAAFSMSPRERLDARLHREAIRRLVPEWSEIPFYKAESGRLPAIKRRRIWEGDDGAAMAEMLAAEELWSGLFEVKRTRKLWKKARRGRAHKHYEAVFERIACRVAFEDYRALLTERIRQTPVTASPH